MSNLAETIAADARLYMMRELAAQTDRRMSDLLLARVIDLYGIRRDRDWVRTQLRKLEALGAVEITAAGETLVAKLTRAGTDHVEERALIVGVTRPSEAE